MAYTTKLALLASVTFVTTAFNAYAVDESVEVEAEFRQAISLTVTDMDFTTGTNVIEFAGTPGATDLVNLGTDGNITTGGTAFTAPTTGQAGDIAVSGATGLTIEVSCSDDATISDGTNSLTVGSLEVVMDTGVAFGSGTDCEGLGTNPLTHTLDGTDVVLMGGQIEGDSGTVTTNVYNTTNAGGTAATIRVVYQ